MQEYRGQFLQVFSTVRPYDPDLCSLGRKAAAELVAAIRNDPRSPEPFLPRLALVLFTQTDQDSQNDASDSQAKLSELCEGLNEGLRNGGAGGMEVPLVGCSVASIPEVETSRVHDHAFSLTLVAARERDLEVQVAGSQGFVDQEKGHERAWTRCLEQLWPGDQGATSVGRGHRDDSFVLAFFPGQIKGAQDFKARGLASYEFLRRNINADLPIYGAGAGERGPLQRRCQVMAGAELIPSGYVCAKVRTSLVFKMQMDHHLRLADEVLLVKGLKEGDSGRHITEVGVAPDFATVSAHEELVRLKAKYGALHFAFRAIELAGRKESLLFHSVSSQDDCLTLAVPIAKNTLIRPAFLDPSDSPLEKDLTKSLPEEGSVAFHLSLICNGIFNLSGRDRMEREGVVLRQLQCARESRGASGFPLVSGFVLGEWGVGPELIGRAQYYHATSLSLADALSPSHKHRQQLEIVERCSRAMFKALLDGDDVERRLTLRRALDLLAEPLFDAVEALGYEGGLISLANELNRRLVGLAERGERWQQIRKTAILTMDEPDLVVRVYNDARQGLPHYVPDCRENQSCPRESSAGVVSQTLVPLWDGRRCLGILQAEHPEPPQQLLDLGGKALVDLAHHLALHLKQVRTLEIERQLDEAVRSAIACGDEKRGWSEFSQAAAGVLEVPLCTIRVLDSSCHFLRLAGGSREILELTLEHDRAYTSVVTGKGPVIKAFHQFREKETENDGQPPPLVNNDAVGDPGIQELVESGPGLARIYSRLGSYALGALVSPKGRKTVGVISFLSFHPHFFSAEREALVRKVADATSILAEAYSSLLRARSMLSSTLSVVTIQAEIDKILALPYQSKDEFREAVGCLVKETSKIIPCEACALHLFGDNGQLGFQAGFPEDLFKDPTAGGDRAHKADDLFLHLAAEESLFRAAGDDLRAQSLIQARSWTWLKKDEGLHSILAIPLTDPRGRRHGVLTLFNQLNEQGRPDDALDFSDVDTQLLSFLQGIATLALDRLGTRDLVSRLATQWNELQKALEAQTDPPGQVNPASGLCHLARVLADWIHAQICSIFLIEHPRHELVLRGCHGWGAGKKYLRRANYLVGDGLTGSLAQEEKPTVISNIFVDPRRTGKYDREMYGQPDASRTFELIALPLRQGKELLGVITLHRALPADHAQALRFNPRDLPALQLASELASLAVSVLTGQTRDKDGLSHEPPAIAEILSAAGQMSLRTLDYSDLADRIARWFKADLCGIFFSESAEAGSLRLRGANAKLRAYVEKVEITKEAGPVGQAFASQKTVFLDLPSDLQYIGELDETLVECLDKKPTSLVAAPMRLGKECEGVILLVNRNVDGFSEKSARLLPQYHLETLGTGILLLRHNIDYGNYLDSVQEAMTEKRAAIEANSVLRAVGHNWRTQLQAIRTQVSNLEISKLEPEEKYFCLSRIKEVVETLSKPLHELLEPIRRAGGRERVDLAEVVRFAVARNEAFAKERHVHVDVSPKKPEVFVLGQRTQLELVVATIMENAIRACDETPRKVSIRILRPHEDGWVRLVISDNGKGIEARDLPYIFAESFTTNPGKEGHGYGLNFSKIITLFFGGDIVAKSFVNQGTEMTLYLRGGSNAEGTTDRG